MWIRALLCLVVVLAVTPAGSIAAAPQDATPKLEVITKAEGLPTVAIITTGGTIAEKTDPKTGGVVPALSGRDLVDAVPGLKAIANIAIMEFSNVDSSQMTPQIWARLSQAADTVLARDDIRGAVITHGTDTMAEAAYFLDVTLKSDKPVVVTGALDNAESRELDGPANLYNAVVQVLSDKTHGWGVTVTLNRYVNSARAARKTNTTNVQAFTSGEKGYLGYVYGNAVRRINDRLHRLRLALPDDLPEALPRVPFISMYAGSDGMFIRHAVENGAQGLVIDGVGSGNVDAKMFEAIKYALAKDIPVVVSSRVYYGSVEPLYGDVGGGKMLQDAGCILAGDLLGTKARLLLILGLMRHGNDPARLKALFAEAD